jgi:hypothetical protein
MVLKEFAIKKTEHLNPEFLSHTEKGNSYLGEDLSQL